MRHFRHRHKVAEFSGRGTAQKSEISLWLDSYDDIFSDFDPRPYSVKALSVDFLEEAERASKDKVFGGIELKFIIPKKKRRIAQEQVIKYRLKAHFKRHMLLETETVSRIFRHGFYFTFSGLIVMLIASIILSSTTLHGFLTNFLIIVLEPAGWFLFWEGLNMIIFESKTKKPRLEFYKKMANCKIRFLSH